jgi:hypothetical protein
VARCALARPPTATRRGGRRGTTSLRLRRRRGSSLLGGARPRPDSPSPFHSRRPILLLPDIGNGVPLLRHMRCGLLVIRPYAGGASGHVWNGWCRIQSTCTTSATTRVISSLH